MDSILQKLTDLSKSTRLVSAEQVLMSHLLSLDSFLNDSLTEEQINKIESTLYSLFSVNKSRISIQCSLFISSKILFLFKKKKNPQLFDIINFALTNPSQPSILCAGFICRHAGNQSKTQLPHFVEFLIQQKAELGFASIYALTGCFKASDGTLTAYMKPSFDYAKKLLQGNSNTLLGMNIGSPNISDPNQQSFIDIIIQLCKQMTKFPDAPIKDILDLCSRLYSTYKTPLLHDNIANLVARCAFSPLYPTMNKKMKEKSDWVISKSEDACEELNGPLEQIIKFGKLTKNILRHFMNLLTTPLIARNSRSIFTYLRKNCPELLASLIPTLPSDTKFDLFTAVSKEAITSEQLQLLILLCPDSNSINEAAAVALLLSTSGDKMARNSSMDFFASFSKTHPSVTLQYLRTSLVFLSHPPDVDRDLENEFHGNACIAATILRNILCLEDALIRDKDKIVEFVEDVFSKENRKQNVSSYRFSDAFLILSILDSLPVSESLASDAVITAVDFLMNSTNRNKKWRNLLKNVLSFRAKFIELAQNNLLVVTALSPNQKYKMTRSILISLEKLVPMSSNIEGWALQTAKLVIESSMKITPQADLMRKFVLRPLPTGNDLVKYRTVGMRREKKAQDDLEKMVSNFPQLFDTCGNNEKTELIKSLVSFSQPVSYLYIYMMYTSFPQKMPKRAYTVFLKKLNDKNLTTLEIVSECISINCKFDTSILPVIYQHIDDCIKNGKNIPGCCILLSALVMHVTIPINYISNYITVLNSLMKTGSSVPFALHCIHSIMLKYSMELSNSGISLNEFSALFETLNQPIVLQPVVLHLCSELFSILLEIHSSNLKAIQNFVDISMQTIYYIPIDYSREAYLKCARSVITFAHSMIKKLTIKYPSAVGVSTSTELVACSVFSDLLKFDEPIEINLSKTVKHVLDLLQKTSDDRPSHFLISLAITNSDVDYWMSLIRQILLVDSVYDAAIPNIEPNQKVKITFLEIASIILPSMSSLFNLKNEYLDDIISAICKSIATNRVLIQEKAFPVLKKLINLFGKRHTENGSLLLDLYDVQFVSAVQVGFTLNLATSGEFLSTYLSFHTSVLTEGDSNSEILNVYVAGLHNCRQRSSHYFSLVLDLCIVARKFQNIAKSMRSFLKVVVPIFAKIIERSMTIKTKDWKKMSNFRNLVSAFYSELPSNFVWLQYLTNNEQIDANALVSFFIVEVAMNVEEWKYLGALNAIPVAFRYFGNKIKPELLNESLRLFAHLPQSQLFNDLLKLSAELIKNDESYNQVQVNTLSISMKSDFFIPEVFANLLYKDTNKKLKPYSVAIALHFVIQIQKGFEASKIVPLFKILFDHSPEVIGIILTVILTKLDSNFNAIKIQIVTIGLTTKAVNNIPMNLISRFIAQSFEQPTGLQMISLIMIKNPTIGIAILSQSVAKVAFLLAANDVQNCRSYLIFIRLCLEILFGNHPYGTDLPIKFAMSTVDLVFDILNTKGNDPQKGPQIMLECLLILQFIRDKCNELFKEKYEGMNNDDKLKVVNMIQKHITKAFLRKKNSNLTIFSGNTRASRFDEWQTLYMSDDSIE